MSLSWIKTSLTKSNQLADQNYAEMEQPLHPNILRLAYAQGYFPMPEPKTGEILWFHPDPRAILPLDKFHVSRSLARSLRKNQFKITVNQAFAEVMQACANRPETWINKDFLSAYQSLHQAGDAHSLEVWEDSQLVGGTYGVSLGGAFFAESMFHLRTDASKIALYHLTQRMRERGMSLLEVQFLTPHLASLGAIEISRQKYLELLRQALRCRVSFV